MAKKEMQKAVDALGTVARSVERFCSAWIGVYVVAKILLGHAQALKQSSSSKVSETAHDLSFCRF